MEPDAWKIRLAFSVRVPESAAHVLSVMERAGARDVRLAKEVVLRLNAGAARRAVRVMDAELDMGAGATPVLVQGECMRSRRLMKHPRN